MPRTFSPTATTKIFTPDLLSACALGMVRCLFLFDLPSVTRKTIFLALTRRPLGRELHHIVSSKNSNRIFAGNDGKNSSIWFMGRCTSVALLSSWTRYWFEIEYEILFNVSVARVLHFTLFFFFHQKANMVIMTTTVAFFFSIHLIAF